MPDRPSRDDNQTTTCPVCHTPFTPVRRQRYCTNACRQIAWRRRHTPTSAPAIDVPAGLSRRDLTIYTCAACEQRYHGQQWCQDCQRPCTRVGLGGLCPHCDEPVAINDLLPHNDTGQVTTMTPG